MNTVLLLIALFDRGLIDLGWRGRRAGLIASSGADGGLIGTVIALKSPKFKARHLSGCHVWSGGEPKLQSGNHLDGDNSAVGLDSRNPR